MIAAAEYLNAYDDVDMHSADETVLVGLVNHIWQAQRQGKGCLPWYLGLPPLGYLSLVHLFLPDDQRQKMIGMDNAKQESPGWENGELRQQLLQLREDEWLNVRDLLLHYRRHQHPLEIFLADIIAAGCLGGDHLWRDLGLPDRGQLSELMAQAFPALSQKNHQDMKWKKFLYKQLCEQEGGYVCRSPSCEVCAAYSDCFGAED